MPSRKSPRSWPYGVLKTKCMAGAAPSDLLPRERAEHALRADGEDQQQHDVRRDILEALGQVRPGQELDEPDCDAAGEGAGDRAEAAEHRGGDRLEPDEP